MSDQSDNSLAPQDLAPADGAVQQLTRADVEAILQDYRKRQMVEHLTGPIVSIALHAVALTLIFLCFGSSQQTVTKEVEVTIEELKVKTLDDKVVEKIKEVQPDEEVPTVPRPDVPADVVGSSEGSGGGSGGGMGGDSGGDFADGPASTDDGTNVDAVLDIKANATPLKLAGLYGGRTAAGRKGMLASGGGSMLTESAVLKALKWLKAHQNEDGSWSKTQPIAMCGLALLTYLSHGETPESAEFGLTVQKAMQYLSNKMTDTSAPLGDYAHGIATYALCESYGMTKIPYLKSPMEKGLKFILDGQQQTGGWDYGYKKAERWDLSVAGWQLQAMKAGYIAGAENPGLLDGIEKGLNWLKKVNFRNGMFGYAAPGAGSPAMQGAGTLCLQLLGEGKSPEAQAGIKYISEKCTVDWKANTGFASYGWYYQTQAMFHAGPQIWKKWNDVFSKELTHNQKPDGHWEAAGDKAGDEKDPYMQTCFCCLMLQVYYRYLPTYKMPKTAAATASALDLNDGKDGGKEDGLKIE